MGEGLEGHAVSILPLTDPDGQTTHLVTGGNEGAVILENQDGGGAVHLILYKADAGGKVLAQADQRTDQLGDVDAAAGHGIKVTALRQIDLHQLLGVVHRAGDAQRKGAQLGANQQRLGIIIADTADGGGALHLLEDALEAGTERRGLDAVDLPLQTDLGVVYGDAGATGAQMGMVVGAEKHVLHTILFRYDAKITAHRGNLLSKSRGEQPPSPREVAERQRGRREFRGGYRHSPAFVPR